MTQKELELKIIAHICTYEEDVSLLIYEGIDEEYFIYSENGKDPLFKNLFMTARNYYQKFNRLLSQEALESKIKQKDDNISSNKILSLFVQAMVLEIDHNSFPMLIKDLRSRKMYTVIQDVMHTIDDSLKNDNPSTTFEKLKDKILQTEADLVKNTKTGNRVYILNESYTDIVDSYMDKKNNPDKYKGIKVGLSVIDEATNGFKPSTLNMVVGASGAGKSVILTNWAAEIFKNGKNVLFISLEMPWEQIKSRYVARELCIDYNRFYNGKLNPEEENLLINKLPDILGSKNGIIGGDGNYLMVVTNFDNPDVDYVEEMIRRFQKMYGKVDAVFVDYLNKMKSREILKSGMQEWAHSGVCAEGLRGLAANYEFVSFTAQQINRSGLEKGRKTMTSSPENFMANQEDITASQKAYHESDAVIGFNPDKANYKMYFSQMKGRDFVFDPFSVNYYPTMNRIVDTRADDTSYMLSPIAAQINSDYVFPTDDDLVDDFGDMN